MLAIPIVLILLALLAWPSVEPHARRWLRRRAQKGRRDQD
jgi:peptidoglycan/LPS O-acetylase OafA/YrhL